ncbi:hypothetical protein Hdeb2414_s0238g00843971 [Helianthus debilis subsp. tardiflorus]
MGLLLTTSLHGVESRNDGCSTRNSPVVGGPFKLIGSDGKLVTQKGENGY